MTTIKNNILTFVKNNDIRMIPRWKVVLFSLLGVCGLIFTFGLLVFFGSLILFVLSRYGLIYMPLFGFDAVLANLRAIPVVLFLVTIVLLVLVEVLVRRYEFTLRTPILTTLLGVTTVALLVSYLISLTPVHQELHIYAKARGLDFMAEQYARPIPFDKMPDLSVVRGEVTEVFEKRFTVQSFDDATTSVVLSREEGTPMLLVPEVGEDIIVFGKSHNGYFEAKRIRSSPHVPFEKRFEHKRPPEHIMKREIKNDIDRNR